MLSSLNKNLQLPNLSHMPASATQFRLRDKTLFATLWVERMTSETLFQKILILRRTRASIFADIIKIIIMFIEKILKD